MKIGFDISDLSTARADGTTRYTYELAKRLPKLLGGHESHGFAPAPMVDQYQLPVTDYQLHVSPWPRFWTQSRLWLDLYRHRPDVLFMPIQQLPIIRPRRMKTVAVIHDLAFHTHPEQTQYKDWALLHIFTAQVAREADCIIAVSQATADDIAKYYGRTEGVHVIHHGVDHDFFRPPHDDEREISWKKLQENFQEISDPYLLFVGQIQPRKNLVRLIEAFEQLAAEDKELQLLIAGSHGWLQQPIFDRIEQSPHRDRILQLGRVDDDQLRALYWNAELFVLPSLYEGFGMPIVEAMASGCPVVTSNISSMPEIAGNAAQFINPLSVKSLIAGVKQARDRREGLMAQGLKQSKRFSWDTTVGTVADTLSSLR